MKNIIVLEWEIHDTREELGFRTGRSTLITNEKNMANTINSVIRFAEHLPIWEFERNDIDMNQYCDGKVRRYYYRTNLSKIISIKPYKEESK